MSILQFFDANGVEVTIQEEDAAGVIDEILAKFGYQVLNKYFKDYDPHKIIYVTLQDGDADFISIFHNKNNHFERYVGGIFE